MSLFEIETMEEGLQLIEITWSPWGSIWLISDTLAFH